MEATQDRRLTEIEKAVSAHDGRLHVKVPDAVFALVQAGKIKPADPFTQVVALWKYLTEAHLGCAVYLDGLWGAEKYGSLAIYSPE